MDKPDPKYVSVQIAATQHSDTDIQVVSEQDTERTHYSVYLRNFDGQAEHVVDFRGVGVLARTSALLRAANLSMEHHIPIEPLL